MDGEVHSLSIAGLLRDVFGVKVNTFSPQVSPLPARAEQNTLGTPYYATDKFGNEVFLPITFTWTDASNQKQTVTLHHAIIGIRGANGAVFTPLTERSGEFMEIVSGNNWRFDIVGVLCSDNKRDFPEAEYKELLTLKKGMLVEMSNAITDLALVDNERQGYKTVFIQEVDFPPVKGVVAYKPFSLQVVSYIPFNLYEIES